MKAFDSRDNGIGSVFAKEYIYNDNRKSFHLMGASYVSST